MSIKDPRLILDTKGTSATEEDETLAARSVPGHTVAISTRWRFSYRGFALWGYENRGAPWRDSHRAQRTSWNPRSDRNAISGGGLERTRGRTLGWKHRDYHNHRCDEREQELCTKGPHLCPFPCCPPRDDHLAPFSADPSVDAIEIS